MAAKKKAAKAGAAAVAVKNSPYVQRVVEDEDLRQNLWQAYESARDAAARLTNGKKFSYPGYNEVLGGAATPPYR